MARICCKTDSIDDIDMAFSLDAGTPVTDEGLKRSSRSRRRIAPKDGKSPGYSVDRARRMTLTIIYKAWGALAALAAFAGSAPPFFPFLYYLSYAISRFAALQPLPALELPARRGAGPLSA